MPRKAKGQKGGNLSRGVCSCMFHNRPPILRKRTESLAGWINCATRVICELIALGYLNKSLWLGWNFPGQDVSGIWLQGCYVGREGRRKTKGSNSRYSTIQSSNILKSVCQYCFRVFAFILLKIASDFCLCFCQVWGSKIMKTSYLF